MTLRELLRSGKERLEAAGIGEAEYDAEELLLFASGLSREGYLSEKQSEASPALAEKYRELIGRREARVPLQHITGFAWFYGYSFIVSPEVLIPRFDTEILVERVLRETSGKGLSVLDLCTGSGIIGCVLMREGSYGSVTASDISAAALRVARKNAEKLRCGLRFIESDLFERIPEVFDVIVSNPPYIAPETLAALEPEVKDHDPRLALDGGPDGLEFYRKIVREAGAHLRDGGRIYFEIGEEQAEAVKELLAAGGYASIEVTKDLSGLDRVISATLRQRG